MCPSEPKPRYEIHSITGYTINPAAVPMGGMARQTTSYVVLDRSDCYREVGWFYSTPGRTGSRDAKRLRQAEELCARLNAEDRADAA